MMPNADDGTDPDRTHDVAERIGEKAARKRRARARGPMGLWFGIGMFGLVGWSVAVPTLIGIGIGIFLDTRLETGFSWTLTLLFGGLFLGCGIAWYWVRSESGEGDENGL